MAVLHRRFLRYLTAMFDGADGTPDDAWRYDPFIGLLEPDLAGG